MKKITAILVIFIFVGTALSAQTFQIKPSAGFAVLADYGFGNGKITKDNATRRSQQIQNINTGIGMFMDVTYAELYVYGSYGYLIHVNKVTNISARGIKTPGPTTRVLRGSALQFGFSLLGKYPIELKSITFFPLLGFNYNTFMLASEWKWGRYKKRTDIPDVVKTFSQFGIQAGAGFDRDLTDRIYFRLEALFQLRFVTENMKAYWDLKGVQNKGKLYPFPGMGPVIKAGFGFKFY
jgi:hypothetical protein